MHPKLHFKLIKLTAASLGIFSLLLITFPGFTESSEYSNAPVNGVLSSNFGWRGDPMSGGHRFHGGIDIAAPTGSPVYLPQDGVVVYSGRYGGYGNVVVVQHGDSLYTLYGHNSYLLVQAGQRVHRGQVLSLVGSTGRSTGPHLHFEVRRKNTYVDPLAYLRYLAGGPGNSFSQQIALAPPTHSLHLSPKPSDSQPSLQTRKPAKAGWSVELVKGSETQLIEF